MKPRFCLDARMMGLTGIGTYQRGLLKGLSRLNLEDRWDCRLAGDPAQAAQNPCGWPVTEFRAPIYSVAEQIQYRKLLSSTDLWHAPHYNIPLCKGKAKLVVTVHDLIHWIYRKDFFTPLKAFYAGTLFRRTVATADHIIAVSKSTKNDLVKHFNASPDKISVIYEAVGEEFSPGGDSTVWGKLQKENAIPDSFFLYVGSLKPHKNVLTLLRAFRNLRAKGKIRASLVITGRKDRSYRPEFRELAELESGNGIHYLPESGQRSILELYRRALALVHPSYYEGFGLTLLEAMACGTPVISSNAASLPEVAGDASLLVDPARTEDFEGAIERIENDSKLRRELQAKGLQQIKKFSWEETGRQTLKVYEKVMS